MKGVKLWDSKKFVKCYQKKTRIIVVGLPEHEIICDLGPETLIPAEVWKAYVLQLAPIKKGVIEIGIPSNRKGER